MERSNAQAHIKFFRVFFFFFLRCFFFISSRKIGLGKGRCIYTIYYIYLIIYTANGAVEKKLVCRIRISAENFFLNFF